jgi:hypothetical protein
MKKLLLITFCLIGTFCHSMTLPDPVPKSRSSVPIRPEQKPTKKALNDNLLQYFSSMDTNYLRSNAGTIQSYLVPINNNIVDYLRLNYFPNDDLESVDVYDPFFTAFAIAFMFNEMNNFQPYYAVEPEAFNEALPSEENFRRKHSTRENPQFYTDNETLLLCCLSAVSGFGELVGAIAAVRSTLVGSSSVASIWGAVSAMAKRTLPWFALGFTIYGMGKCFGWW